MYGGCRASTRVLREEPSARGWWRAAKFLEVLRCLGRTCRHFFSKVGSDAKVRAPRRGGFRACRAQAREGTTICTAKVAADGGGRHHSATRPALGNFTHLHPRLVQCSKVPAWASRARCSLSDPQKGSMIRGHALLLAECEGWAGAAAVHALHAVNSYSRRANLGRPPRLTLVPNHPDRQFSTAQPAHRRRTLLPTPWARKPAQLGKHPIASRVYHEEMSGPESDGGPDSCSRWGPQGYRKNRS